MTEHPAQSSSPTPSSEASELPTEAAELRIMVGPTQRMSAQGTVPADQARLIITTFGVVGSAVAGITGAILTIRITDGTVGVALASGELVLALVAAVLIAVTARTSRRRPS
jgi:hypothetical protein